VATAKVGIDQRRLRRSSTMAGVGDGVVAVALPLLAANLTHDPVAIAAVIAMQHLPWVLVHAGWRFLRWDRRTVLGTVDTGRAVVLGMIGLLSLIGRETILDIQLVALVVGFGEALTDGTETETEDVGGLSARGMAGLAIVGLPLGGILYEIYPATPFLFEVLAFAVAALYALLVRRPVVAPDVEPEAEPIAPRGSVPGTGAVTVSAAAAAFATSAVLGVLVLFALEDLGLGAPAFGLLLAGLAVATAAGAFVAPEVGTALGLKAGLVLAAAVAAGGYATASQVADPDRPLAGAVALGIAAGAGMVVAVLSRALLQRNAGRAVTGPVLQRFHLAVWSAIPLGALAGGWIAGHRSVHEVLLWSTAGWAAAAIAAVLSHPAEKTPEFV
jgi:hypothetical protein